MTSDIPDEAVTAMREAADAYYEHDCTRDDECCYRRPDWLGALSAGLAAALPVLNTAKDSEPVAVELERMAAEVRESATLPAKDAWDSGWRSGIDFCAGALDRRAASLRGEQG